MMTRWCKVVGVGGCLRRERESCQPTGFRERERVVKPREGERGLVPRKMKGDGVIFLCSVFCLACVFSAKILL